MADATVKLSITELPQFQRLVDFAREVEHYATANEDHKLSRIVDELAKDLAELSGE